MDIIQPDPSHAGGITECRKIAAMAEAYDVAIALHCPLGPIALAACLQLDAVCYNAFIQEQRLGIHYNADQRPARLCLNKDVFDYEDGYVAIPQAPGLGSSRRGLCARACCRGPPLAHPVWRHKDGSFAEW